MPHTCTCTHTQPTYTHTHTHTHIYIHIHMHTGNDDFLKFLEMLSRENILSVKQMRRCHCVKCLLYSPNGKMISLSAFYTHQPKLLCHCPKCLAVSAEGKLISLSKFNNHKNQRPRGQCPDYYI